MFLLTRQCPSLVCIFACLLATALSPVPVHAQNTHAQNIVQDPSFETPALGSTNSYVTFFAGQSFGSWSVDAGSIDLARTNWQETNGLQSLDMSGNGPGTIHQDLQTITGRTYTLAFSLAGNPTGDTKSLSVFWNGMKVPGSPFLFKTAGRSLTKMGWRDVTVTGLIATDSLTPLEFQSNTNTGCGPTLDNVRVTLAAAPPRALVVTPAPRPAMPGRPASPS